MTVMGLADPDEGGRGEGPEWVVGLLEHYPETVSLFAAACPEHFPEPEAVHKKRVTLHKPPLEEALSEARLCEAPIPSRLPAASR